MSFKFFNSGWLVGLLVALLVVTPALAAAPAAPATSMSAAAGPLSELVAGRFSTRGALRSGLSRGCCASAIADTPSDSTRPQIGAFHLLKPRGIRFMMHASPVRATRAQTVSSPWQRKYRTHAESNFR